MAESDDTVVVEGNHYFPRGDVRFEFLEASDHRSVCGWKGEARYHHVVVEGERNEDAAWEYPDPTPRAGRVKDRIRSGRASASANDRIGWGLGKRRRGLPGRKRGVTRSILLYETTPTMLYLSIGFTGVSTRQGAHTHGIKGVSRASS